MGDGVADDLDQRPLDRAQHIGVQADAAADADEDHLLAERLGAVAGCAFKLGEEVAGRHQAQLFGRLAQLAQFAVHLVDRGPQAALDAVEGVPQGLGGGVGAVDAGPGAARGQLLQQKVGQMLAAFHRLGRRPQAVEQGVGLRHPLQEGVHLGDVGADRAQALVHDLDRRGRRLGVFGHRRQGAQLAADVLQPRQHRVDPLARHRVLGLAIGRQLVLDRVAVVGDLALFDHPRRALEGVGQA